MDALPAQTVTRLAPAKINLALHVTGKRRDGYHLIESLAVFTRFGDRLTVEPAEADEFIVTGPFATDVPVEGGNLVMAARDKLRASLQSLRPTSPPSVLPDISPARGEIEPAARISPIANVSGQVPSSTLPISPLAGEMSGRTEGGDVGRDVSSTLTPVLIRLEKNLPVASGVGGGSSDAAATLHALADLWGLGDPAALAHIGQSLGADVPMCLAAKPLVARGAGEILEPLPRFPALALVLVNPGIAVSTAAVFAALERTDNDKLPPLPKSPDFHSVRNWLETTRNDLEPAARTLQPEIGAAAAALDRAGSAFTRMSGSGATCFGLFETGNVAKRAAIAIRARHPGWFVAATRSMEADPDGQ